MSNFFESEFVKSELIEISELQNQIYKKIFNFTSLPKEEKLNHICLMEKLIVKQKILYTRMSLSEDPEAKSMIEKIIKSTQMLGFNEDLQLVLDHMHQLLQSTKEQVDTQ